MMFEFSIFYIITVAMCWLFFKWIYSSDRKESGSMDEDLKFKLFIVVMIFVPLFNVIFALVVVFILFSEYIKEVQKKGEKSLLSRFLRKIL